jgi:hypothetical protein
MVKQSHRRRDCGLNCNHFHAKSTRQYRQTLPAQNTENNTQMGLGSREKETTYPKTSDNVQTLQNTVQDRKVRGKDSLTTGAVGPLHALLCELLLLFDARGGGAGLRENVVGEAANEPSKRVSVML